MSRATDTTQAAAHSSFERAMVDAELVFRPESEGGRAIPPGVLAGLQYKTRRGRTGEVFS
jgi:hypothetical protein